jgi:hypothetical protein
MYEKQYRAILNSTSKIYTQGNPISCLVCISSPLSCPELKFVGFAIHFRPAKEPRIQKAQRFASLKI